MKALITGAEGQLGVELARLMPKAIAAGKSTLDITDESLVWTRLTRSSLDVVFHCAAKTDVDACERDPASARRVNTIGTRNIATVCGALGIHLIALSTDYVFDGRTKQDNAEDAAVHPLSVYGKTKLDAEECVEQLCPSHAIVRTSWLYGSGPNNFVRRVVDGLSQGTQMGMVVDQISNPTWARDLAPALVGLAQKRMTGIFHLMNEGAASRYEWARCIGELGGFDPGLVHEASSYPALARRPGRSALRNLRASHRGLTLRPWQQALAEYMSLDTGIQDMLKGSSGAVA
ncbi:MAG TPA: dTDP-4-dehydrorhamnose reductase [Chloroflexota bacterium]|nr:dTDP-4-dehydrorhamnose reductase [Chloroflexota bacterium]